jgi:hypothetical protein
MTLKLWNVLEGNQSEEGTVARCEDERAAGTFGEGVPSRYAACSPGKRARCESFPSTDRAMS